MAKLEVHPVAGLFPMLADDELAELAADIKERGLLQPIMLDAEGRILDGRNRYEACQKADIKPAFETYAGDDAIGYALSVNINRRHLSKGQRAMATAMAYPEPEKGGRGNSSKIKDFIQSGALSQARTVLKWEPELAKTVMNGLPLSDAYATALETKKRKEETEAKITKLKSAAPDIYDLVETGRQGLNEAIGALKAREDEMAAQASEADARAKREVEELKQQRWAATSNLIDGIILFDRHKAGDGAEMAALMYDPDVAASRGEKITPKRIRNAIAYLQEIADTMDEKK
jgi:ParB-like nuclease domain